MIINDQFIIDFFYVNDRINSNKTKLFKLNKIDKSIINYLDNRYDDSESYIETINRIKYNIDIRPTCKICNNKVKWLATNKYRTYCSCTCKNIDLYEYVKNKSIIKYGSPFNRTKFKITYNSKEVRDKLYNTKKKNHTFNSSNKENQTYNFLKEKYKDIIRQYKSDLYPFACDFYIPSLDLYIECNYHWTHGNKLYEGTKEDNLILEQWKSKNTQYYNNAINTWTNLDIKKYNIAKENNLNYICFYSFKDFLNWLNNINT